jgi:hypothetical protein
MTFSAYAGRDNPSGAVGSYKNIKQKFSDMGLCSACADNVTQYYRKKPDSRCGALAKKALAGNPEAETELIAFPSYCVWEY